MAHLLMYWVHGVPDLVSALHRPSSEDTPITSSCSALNTLSVDVLGSCEQASASASDGVIASGAAPGSSGHAEDTSVAE